MKIAFIHSDKKIGTGANFINDLMTNRMRDAGVKVKNFYPKIPLLDAPLHLRGFGNVLFFYSLLEHREAILKYDLIQGTTYTPIAFLSFPIPVVSHFGSTSWGFLQAVPLAKDLEPPLRKIWFFLKEHGVIHELNVRTRRPLRDVAEVEKLVALRADAVIATSEIVQQDLLDVGVPIENIYLVPNAIEDYWFTHKKMCDVLDDPAIVFLGRMGADAFTLKLKGFDRLIDYYQYFKNVPKHTIGITTNAKLVEWCDRVLLNHFFYPNTLKENIPDLLQHKAGSILVITSRYEGFSLSLVEGMSQGLIPVSYPVGIAPEIIQNGKNGFLIRSQAEGKKVIESILQMTKGERQKLARAAQETSRQFNSKTISRQLLDVYKKTLQRNKKPNK